MFRQAQAIEAAEAVVLLQGALGFRWTEGGAGHWRESQLFGHQAGRSASRAAAQSSSEASCWASCWCRALLSSRCITCTSPVLTSALARPQRSGCFPWGRLHHHRRQPVVAAGAEHALLQHGAGGQHPGDVPLEQGTLGGGGFELIAEGHAVALLDQFAAVALGGVVGDARHRDPADRLAAFLAGEGELQHLGRVRWRLRKSTRRSRPGGRAGPVRDGPQLYVVAQHRCELQRVQLAVVGPGRFVTAGFGIVCRLFFAAALA